MAPREEPGLFLGPRRKWGFQEATALFFFFLALFKGKEPPPLHFSWAFAHLLRGGVPSFPGHTEDLRRKGPKATLCHGAAQHRSSFSHSLTLSKTRVHSFIQQALTDGLLSTRPGHQNTREHKCLHVYVHARTVARLPCVHTSTGPSTDFLALTRQPHQKG